MIVNFLDGLFAFVLSNFDTLQTRRQGHRKKDGGGGFLLIPSPHCKISLPVIVAPPPPPSCLPSSLPTHPHVLHHCCHHHCHIRFSTPSHCLSIRSVDCCFRCLPIPMCWEVRNRRPNCRKLLPPAPSLVLIVMFSSPATTVTATTASLLLQHHHHPQCPPHPSVPIICLDDCCVPSTVCPSLLPLMPSVALEGCHCLHYHPQRRCHCQFHLTSCSGRCSWDSGSRRRGRGRRSKPHC